MMPPSSPPNGDPSSPSDDELLHGIPLKTMHKIIDKSIDDRVTLLKMEKMNEMNDAISHLATKNELKNEIKRLEDKVDAGFAKLEDKMDAGFADLKAMFKQMDIPLDTRKDT
eukprot:CAMPEP_0182863116 /NCGR_PEP_ID=MMETSP0034_2-20130328/6460_1 /TAXON_ID=156128 /ORGANISM="Nephroselmis pyriformis, Strain CCMP717" /LENGTH=111 /DNA_ID=CAMNT_0024995285 /DNA_START=19 /DNA_END=354 /DNA_ORIENTATION=+